MKKSCVLLCVLVFCSSLLAAVAAPVKHRFVCIDNKRNQLILVDQFDPSRGWVRAIPGGSRDLQVLPGNCLLVSHGNGAAMYDLRNGKPLVWRIAGLAGINTARKLKNGLFILGGFGGKEKRIKFYLYDSAGRKQREWEEQGTSNIRLVRETRAGNLLHVSSNPRRVVEASYDGKILRSLPLKQKGYKAVELENGNVLIGLGDGCTVEELNWKGETQFRVGGKDKFPKLGLDFFSGYDVLANGNIVSTNWLGHGKHGTGPHLVEFDRKNNLVWQWEDHKLAAQITNVLVLDHLEISAGVLPGKKEAAAELAVKSSSYALFGTLRKFSLIHYNRGYRFREVPEPYFGLRYLLNGHKKKEVLDCKASSSGRIWLALGEGASVPEGEGKPAWHFAGRWQGDDGSSQRDWTVFYADVAKGDHFKITSPNKWGATLIAREVRVENKDGAPGRLDEAQREFSFLANQLKKRPDEKRQARLAAEAYHHQSLILKDDRDPVDIVLRRTRALLNDLLAQKVDLGAEALEFSSLAKAVSATDPKDGKARRKLFAQVRKLRRRIAFKNPLLDFESLCFLTHFRPRRNHMCDQYFGFYANTGGGLYVLDKAFSESPEVRNVLAESKVENGPLAGKALSGGSFISLELSHDGKTFFFAWTAGDPSLNTWEENTTYHVFRVNVDGTDLRQLTSGPYNEFDPCELPDGSLVFISERRGGYGRCHGRPVPTYTLHRMNRDGSGIRALSFHETNEWHPSLDHDGMLLYCRWDYVDRDSDVAHHLWSCFPDGRDPRSLHGNYPVDRHSRPWMEMSTRAIPGSFRYISVAAPHHGHAYGSLLILDQRLDDDNSMSQIRRFTPETPFPESERGALQYGTPWPLSEKYHLCVFAWDSRQYGIYLVDAFGNRELVYQDPGVPCLDPIPLRPRKREPQIPDQRLSQKKTTVAVMNIYDADFAWPEGSKPSALRVVQLYPKTTPPADRPRIGLGAQSLARGVLGTVPIESDGSVHFEMPADILVYFQVLDEQGLMIQNMRSATYAHSGTRLTCVGCHEPKRQTSDYKRQSMPLALLREPSRLVPEPSGANPLAFARLVQPVLDAQCLRCHDGKKNKINLRGDQLTGNQWSKSFDTLRRYAWARHGGNGAIKRNQGSRSRPGLDGARGSRLYKLLSKGHKKVELSPEELRRITLWIDCNSVFFSAYHDLEKQSRGELVKPTLY